MLDIIALSYNELPPVVPVRGSIPDEGGTIGRDSENTLVLPDPARLVSRKHGRFVREGDVNWIVNISDGNSFLVNERDVSAGAKCQLADGDLLQIGGYVLRIRLSSGQPAGVSANATSGVPDARSRAAVSGQGLPPAEISRKTVSSPPIAATLPGPFDDLLGTPVAPPKELFRHVNEADGAVGSVGPGGQADLHIIPADFDPFGEVSRRAEATESPTSVASGADSLSAVLPTLSPFSVVADDPDLGVGREDSELLHNRFAPGLASDQDVHDPLELFKDESRSNALLDPLRLEPGAAPSMGRAPELAAAFRLPVSHPVELDEGMRCPEPEAATTGASAMAVGPESAHGASSEACPTQTVAHELKAVAAVSNPDSTRLVDVALESSASVRSISTTSASISDLRAELRRAFEAGLQAELPQQSMDFNTETLRMIGALVRISLEGTLDLMRARSAVKREVRVEMTVIEPNDNNPLKLSPDVDVAIQYLFGRKYPGFLGPIDAMTEAYSDLTAHQMGMVAGMRSAMEDMIRRFDPARIEADSAAKGMLSRLSRTHGRSDCWDAYCARYQGIADALGKDFQDFYAQAFIRAYEEEIAGCSRVASPT